MAEDKAENKEPAENPGEKELREHFPTLYITLVSIVVALAVEGLLGRLGSLSENITGLAYVLLILQIAHYIFTASIFWWISTRWVATVPWPFGILDGISMIGLLVVFFYVSQSIGTSFNLWLLSFGILAISSGILYRYNGRRGIEHTGRSARLSKLHLLPSTIPLLIGLPLIWGWYLTRFVDPAYSIQIVIVTIAFAGTIALAWADLWIWREVSREPSRFD